MTVLQPISQNINTKLLVSKSFWYKKKKKSPEFNNQIQIQHTIPSLKIGKVHAKSTRTKLYAILTTTSSPERLSKETTRRMIVPRLQQANFLLQFFPLPLSRPRISLDDRRRDLWAFGSHSMDSHLRDTSINCSLARSLCFSFFSMRARVLNVRSYLSVAGERRGTEGA